MAYPKSDIPRAERQKRWRQENADLIKARKKASYEKNREKILAERREKYAASIDQSRERGRKAAASRGDDLKRYRREYYQANAETIRRQVSESKRRNPDRVLHCNRKRRAIMRGVEATLTRQDVSEITAQQKHRCAWCSSKSKLTVDHITPLARGGHHVRSNIQMLCAPCNAKKGAKDPIDFARFEGQLL